MKMIKTIDVLVLGYYGFGNLGDELLSKAVVDNLVSAGVPKERIVLLSASPESSEALTGVKCFNRWNLGTVAALIKQSKSFLLGGGGLFQDVTSVKSCGYYWWIVRLAKMSAVKIWALSQSVGPLNTALGRWFAKNALKQCVYLGVRDKKSSQLLSGWSIKHTVAPDFVLGTECAHSAVSGDALLLNLRPGYDETAEKAVRTANFIAKRDKLKIRGVAFAREDYVYMENLEADGVLKLKDIVLVNNMSDFENVSATAVKAVGMRLHFAELCAVCSIPAAAASYDPKVEAFCSEWNIPVLEDKISDDFATADREKLQSVRIAIAAATAEGLKAVSD